MSAQHQLRIALEEAMRRCDIPLDAAPLVLERPRDPKHGDVSTPLAMSLAKALRRNPVQIAESLAEALEVNPDHIASVDVLKPGFINFRLADSLLFETLRSVHDQGDNFGRTTLGRGQKVQVEYVSANPTGPLVIVSARAAAVGSVLVNLLKFAGFDAEGEYYVNDAGNQVRKLGDSLRYRLRERAGELDSGEELGDYPGEYLADIAAETPDNLAHRWISDPDAGRAAGDYAAQQLLGQIRGDLEAFGAHFDSFFQESTLYPDAVNAAEAELKSGGFTYEEDGALFFRTTRFGDDKDRVLRKSDGVATYFLGDIAYHRDKANRGFRRAITLLGPDHHGHVPRMQAAMQAFGEPADWFEAVLVGWVRLLESGTPVSMSKRLGEFITMRELMDDVGTDVAKYFFLMRRANTPLDFDLTLARTQSDENPVYYVQYAHARISSVARFAREKGCTWDWDTVDLTRLVAPEERALMLQLYYFDGVIDGAVKAREPHRLTNYAQDLANAFHSFYHECRIVSDDAALSSARLLLAEATMQVLRNTLTLAGVSAPASM